MKKRIQFLLLIFVIKIFSNKIYFLNIPISLQKALIKESNAKKESRIWKPNMSLFFLKKAKKKTKKIIPIKFNFLKGFFEEEENKNNIFGDNLIDIENFDCDCSFTKINLPQILDENDLKKNNIEKKIIDLNNENKGINLENGNKGVNLENDKSTNFSEMGNRDILKDIEETKKTKLNFKKKTKKKKRRRKKNKKRLRRKNNKKLTQISKTTNHLISLLKKTKKKNKNVLGKKLQPIIFLQTN